jgi:hypothetical protein
MLVLDDHIDSSISAPFRVQFLHVKGYLYCSSFA